MPDQNAGAPSHAPSSSAAVSAPAGRSISPGAVPNSRAVQTTKTATPPVETKDSVREIIETVVFVLVLVLLLKAFVAEAFVIPTGSMAETLYGYQKTIKCPKCKRDFPVNCSCEVDPKQASAKVVGGTCPNCFYHVDLPSDFGPPDNWPRCSTGDRVLVGKFFYDFRWFKLDGPKRYQVVVFKYPKEPQQLYEAMNYIKRAIGMPGQTIAIHYGKLYGCEEQTLTPQELDADAKVPPLKLWERQYMHQDSERAREFFRDGKFQILRKPPPQILAERRIVYDNDFQAQDLIGKVPPRWKAGSGSWTPDNPDQPKRFEHAAANGQELAWLRYQHLVPDRQRNNAEVELISDFVGYNTWEAGFHSSPAQNWVGDLMLECEVQITQPRGQLVLELSKGVDRFQAQCDLSTGSCTLIRRGEDGEKTLDKKDTPLKQAGRYRVRFANVDQQLVVWVDRPGSLRTTSSLPFGKGVAYPAPRRKGPTKDNDLEPASIGVREAGVVVSGLQLWRDTYYTANIDAGGPDAGEHVNFGSSGDWAPLQELPVRTFYVQPGHYLCLGDNSPESSDGRSWGAVPQRLLLGRALLVYWPIFNRFGRIE